ncbi:hypothetical protein F3Y22_tig00110020pilonHSYRG00459 [Hibiscus syriacus]|uniref:Uncharacterized protein n=1 Tax=Hibiscus syriacus TaxID=106335 RepID=A0A6A3BSW8_HIBSY|nr:hypothetical protein F3Y22_tig00110020pilonHSYRG00459 [Hibiscus syriacus]
MKIAGAIAFFKLEVRIHGECGTRLDGGRYRTSAAGLNRTAIDAVFACPIQVSLQLGFAYSRFRQTKLHSIVH